MDGATFAFSSNRDKVDNTNIHSINYELNNGNWFKSTKPDFNGVFRGFQQQNCEPNIVKSRFTHSSPYSLPVSCYSKGRERKKRRGVSPKIFPRKVHVTEDKVAMDMGNLHISHEWQSKSHYNTKRQRTFSEIEDNINVDSDSEEEELVQIKISHEYQKEIDKFKHSIMRTKADTLKPDFSTALVLWQPPSGVVQHLRDSLLSKPEITITENEVIKCSGNVKEQMESTLENQKPFNYDSSTVNWDDVCTNGWNKNDEQSVSDDFVSLHGLAVNNQYLPNDNDDMMEL